LLDTHLSFPEIAAELFLSPHTVESHAVPAYRKLEVASRSQAVARSLGSWRSDDRSLMPSGG
jgi:LuxR family transcriptional regulator, maltose regulon positive regulatory protein